MNNPKNILLETFDKMPFSKVNNKDYLPAFIELIKENPLK